MNMRITNFLFVSLLSLLLSGCNASSITIRASNMGETISLAELESIINIPGPIEFEKHLAARWSVNLSGLLNLEHPLAVRAGLEDRDEPIELYVYSITHPVNGTYLIDSGISERFITPDENPDLSFLIKIAMNTDRLLANIENLREWQYGPSGIIDIFGDKSIFAIHSPGHSPGSTAYLVRSTQRPQLLIGDATHTRWGWENGVEPGTFSADQAKSAESLQRLLSLSQDFPAMLVHPGHQNLSQ